MTNRNLPTAYSASETASRVLQPARDGGLGEPVRIGTKDGLIVGMSCIGPQEYLVQFDDGALARWFAHEDVASAA